MTFTKKYKSFLLLILPFLFIQSSPVPKNVFEEEDGIWSGTVSFIEKQTGKEIEISEWRMEATIVKNKATAIHSFKFRDKNDNISDCKNEDQTDLEVGIDYDEGTYGITVPMPGCYGKQISAGNTTDFAKTDETAISINDQVLKDPNILEGTITERSGSEENGDATTTTYKWHLVRSNKIKKPVSQNANKPKPGIVQPYKKELWSGTVIWSKFSTGKARVVSYDHGFENAFSWDHYLSFHTDVNFIKSKGTVYRADTVTKWEKDSTIFIHPQNKYMIEERMTKIYKKGKGDFDLDVQFSEDKKTYWISFFGPICPEYHFFEKRNNIHGNGSDTSMLEDAGFQTILPADATGHPVGNNPNVLSGVFEEIIPANPQDPAGEAIITRARWELKKVKQ
ncbi:MAG: hypothetical protein ABUT20_03150 [Bacteroidota bacterium]